MLGFGVQGLALRVTDSLFGVRGLGPRGWGSEFRVEIGVWRTTSRVQYFGFRVSSFGFRVSVFGFRFSCFGFRASGFGFRDSGLDLPRRRRRHTQR